MNQGCLSKKVDLNDPELANAFEETSLWGAYFGKLLLELLIYSKKPVSK